MQRQICVAANPVTVAMYVLCNCDRQWMVEAVFCPGFKLCMYLVCAFYKKNPH